MNDARAQVSETQPIVIRKLDQFGTTGANFASGN
jgi:hypothetical protein